MYLTELEVGRWGGLDVSTMKRESCFTVSRMKLLRLEPVALHLPPKGGPADPEILGGFGPIPPISAEGRPYGLGLALLQGGHGGGFLGWDL